MRLSLKQVAAAVIVWYVHNWWCLLVSRTWRPLPLSSRHCSALDIDALMDKGWRVTPNSHHVSIPSTGVASRGSLRCGSRSRLLRVTIHVRTESAPGSILLLLGD